MKSLVALVLALTALSAPLASQAQTSPLIIDQNRPDRTPPAAEPAPAPSPMGAGRVEAAPPAASTTFILRQVEIRGSSLPPAALAAAYHPYVGRNVAQADLSALADAVGAVYAKSDIALYTVLLPRQTFEDGRVRLVVVEGYVSEVIVDAGKSRGKIALMRRYGDHLRQERPLRRKTLERYLSLVRDIAGTKTEVRLLQGGSPGAVKIVLQSKLRPFDAGVSVNNHGAAYLGRTQIQIQATANSLLRQGDSTTVSLAFPTQLERFQYVSLSHTEPLWGSGATLNLNLGYLRTKPLIGGGLDLSGTATMIGAQITYPLLRSYKQDIFLTAGVDGLNSDNALFGRRFSSEKTRALRLAASYRYIAANRVVAVSLAISQGIDGLGARVGDSTYAKPDYRKANLQGTFTQVVDKRWIVRLSAGAQIGGERLPGSEQFSIGGTQFGRAFTASEAVGDSGYGVSAELAYRPSRGLPKALAGSEAYAFTDRAEATSRRQGKTTEDLASIGGGVRLAMAAKGVVELEASKAIEETRRRGGDRPWRLSLNFRSTF